MNSRDRAILSKIIDEADIVSKLLQGIDDRGFLTNEEKMRAVCMTLINIGELVKNITDVLQEKHDNIPWKDLAGLRDVTAHAYFTLRMQDIWIYAAVELPIHAKLIKEILDEWDS